LLLFVYRKKQTKKDNFEQLLRAVSLNDLQVMRFTILKKVINKEEGLKEE
jgi:hypothetical protein